VSQAILAAGVTCLIEVPLVALFFPGERLRMAGVALVANVATNLTLNVLLPAWGYRGAHWLFWGELAVMLVEAAVYVLLSRGRDLGRALLASGLGNASSFAWGGAVAALLLRM
jgi:hypothetical protein